MKFKCPRCQSEESCYGKLESPVYGMVIQVGSLQFIPDEDERKFLSLETRGISVSAMMCQECGALELTGDAEKLRRITDSG